MILDLDRNFILVNNSFCMPQKSVATVKTVEHKIILFFGTIIFFVHLSQINFDGQIPRAIIFDKFLKYPFQIVCKTCY